jgi:hypothetical protein
MRTSILISLAASALLAATAASAMPESLSASTDQARAAAAVPAKPQGKGASLAPTARHSAASTDELRAQAGRKPNAGAAAQPAKPAAAASSDALSVNSTDQARGSYKARRNAAGA